MSIQFIVNGEYVTPKDAKDKRVVAAQFSELAANRLAGEQFQGNLVSIAANEGRINASMKQSAINEQIDLMYREIDNTPAFEPKAFGNQALLSRLLSEAVPVNVGKKVVKMRRVSEAGLANISITGQLEIKTDNTDSSYQAAVVPVFDAAYGLDWRDREAGLSGMFDQVIEDSQEITFAILEKANDFLFNGNASLVVDGTKWAGIKGTQQGIDTATLAVDLSAAATTMEQVVNEVLRVWNILLITNKCSGNVELAVSPQIYQNWRRIGSAADSSYGNILEVVKAYFPEVQDIYPESSLTGNQLFMYKRGRDGMHARSGMALSNYALPRFKHNDRYDYVKWMACGFMAKQSYAGLKTAIYASS